MRPIKLGPYSPITSSTTGFATALTGAGPFTPTATACSDTLAHRVTLTSVSDLHLINVTITGTSAETPNGPPLTETIAGPAANTVTTTNHFLTVTAISVSSTLGANTMNVGWSASSVSPPIPLNRMSRSPAIYHVVITGTLGMNIDQTVADIYDGSVASKPWATLVSNTIVSSMGTFDEGASAGRFNVASVTNGATYTIYISQASGFVI